MSANSTIIISIPLMESPISYPHGRIEFYWLADLEINQIGFISPNLRYFVTMADLERFDCCMNGVNDQWIKI